MIDVASVEDGLTLWASLLRDTMQRIRPLFTQERLAATEVQRYRGARRKRWQTADLPLQFHPAGIRVSGDLL